MADEQKEKRLEKASEELGKIIRTKEFEKRKQMKGNVEKDLAKSLEELEKEKEKLKEQQRCKSYLKWDARRRADVADAADAAEKRARAVAEKEKKEEAEAKVFIPAVDAVMQAATHTVMERVQSEVTKRNERPEAMERVMSAAAIDMRKWMRCHVTDMVPKVTGLVPCVMTAMEGLVEEDKEWTEEETPPQKRREAAVRLVAKAKEMLLKKEEVGDGVVVVKRDATKEKAKKAYRRAYAQMKWNAAREAVAKGLEVGTNVAEKKAEGLEAKKKVLGTEVLAKLYNAKAMIGRMVSEAVRKNIMDELLWSMETELAVWVLTDIMMDNNTMNMITNMAARMMEAVEQNA
jgi:adenosyl cobinamide kinase/adenosyl cobinamide phosphate guanylyltransferase